MLDSDTRRRIDSARDILVGKVPDPKSQVEQITIALVYKFMDDMDKQSIELGGKASFFKGEFEKYSWSNIFNPRMGGMEMLNLYGEAITRMSQNPNLPQLFRDIFKNAFLPYRDPETLKLFLKTINEFTYDHSEKLGDAFEYLLSVLGSQGDAGQFRTPRHIIDFMVQVVGPQKNETVLDPACGTAGFLISAYKHIVKSSQEAGEPLTTQEKQRLYENFRGYDISPDMVRLSLVNLYLHGFVKPQIHEYDTLASEERWNEYADVILANPPFMSPKGGIMPHKKFSVQSNRSEVLFVDYMAEHLTPTGKAGIIVPEGIIFQSSSAYKGLRKMLVNENSLWAVVSLPAGVFNPYAGVKTSILLLDKALAKKTDKIMFVKVEADGFDLGAQRRPNGKDDLPNTLDSLRNWQTAIQQNQTETFDASSYLLSVLLVPKAILADSEYNLSGDRYKEVVNPRKYTWPTKTISELTYKILSGGTPSTKIEEFWTGDIPWITSGNIVDLKSAVPTRFITEEAKEKSATNLIPRGNIIVVTRVGLGKLFLNDFDVCISQDSQGLIIKNELVIPEYLLYVLSEAVQSFKTSSQGAIIQGVTKDQLASLQIPLPPLDIQCQIIEEIEGFQRIIDGARQVVEGWKPNLALELDDARNSAGVDEWEVKTLEDVCNQITDGTHRTPKYTESGVPFWRVTDITKSNDSKKFISPDEHQELIKRCKPEKGDVLYSKNGTIGVAKLVDWDWEFSIFVSLALLKPKTKLLNPNYLEGSYAS